MIYKSEMKRDALTGYSSVLFAYIMWGVLPIYWHLLKDIPPLVVLVHRVVWSCLLIGLVLLAKGQLRAAWKALFQPETRRYLCWSSLFLVTNWLTYIWAMAKGLFIEASMGYFLCPLFTIFLGAIVFKEKLSRGQLLAIACLATGIGLPIFMYGAVPWVAMALAGSWAGYASIRKCAPIGSLQGVFIETALLSVPVVGISMFFYGSDAPTVPLESTEGVLMMMCAGFVTALPQVALLEGIKRISLTFAGVTQYTAPTITLLLSVYYFRQTVSPDQVTSLIFIWVGIAIFFVGDWTLSRSRRFVSEALGSVVRMR